MNTKQKPIGFFDSGVGGISVLKETIKVLPNEKFIYFGDSKNAPYGTKSVEQVKELSLNVVNFLLEKNVKAIVVACNTATSAAIDEIRKKYNSIPIIGIEPAVKPAVELNKEGNIVIMATPMTLSEKKFNNLVKDYKGEVNVMPLPCPGLVELIESGVVDGEEISSYLKDRLTGFDVSKITSIVLGCTHYPFIRKELINILGENISVIDGSLGTAKQLKRQLINHNLLNDNKDGYTIEIYNSSEKKELIDLSYRLLKL